MIQLLTGVLLSVVPGMSAMSQANQALASEQQAGSLRFNAVPSGRTDRIRQWFCEFRLPSPQGL